MQDEQLLATKLQEAVMVVGSASMVILGFGRVKVRRSRRGSAKKAGDSGREKFCLTTAQEVSREPQFNDQSLAMGSERAGAILLLSVRSLACAEAERVNELLSTAFTKASWMDTWVTPPRCWSP